MKARLDAADIFLKAKIMITLKNWQKKFCPKKAKSLHARAALLLVKVAIEKKDFDTALELLKKHKKIFKRKNPLKRK